MYASYLLHSFETISIVTPPHHGSLLACLSGGCNSPGPGERAKEGEGGRRLYKRPDWHEGGDRKEIRAPIPDLDEEENERTKKDGESDDKNKRTKQKARE